MASAEYEGYLEKKGTEGLGTSWKKRYFALVGKFLFYYKSEKDFKGRKEPQGKIDLSSATIDHDLSDKLKKSFTFGITTPKKTYPLLADSGSTRDAWLKMLHAAKGERYVPSSAVFAQDAKQQASVSSTQPVVAAAPVPVTRDEVFTATPTNALLVTFHMENIPKMDGGISGKCDPYFVMFNGQTPSDQILYASEVVSKDLNPKFAPCLIPLHEVGGPQGVVRINVFDRDDDGKDDSIGYFTCQVSGLAQRGKRFPMTLDKGDKKKLPELIVADAKIVEIPAPGIPYRAAGRGIELTVSGIKLEKKDSGIGAKSDPFLLIRKGATVIYRSEVKPKTLDPDWDPVCIDLKNDVDYFLDEITVECWDHDEDGGRDFIGMFKTRMARLAHPGYKWPLIGKSTKDGSNAGCILVKKSVPLPGPPLQLTLPAPAYQFKISARHVAKESLTKKSDPFFVAVRGQEILYRSEVIKDTSSPNWKPFVLPTSALLPGNNTGGIKICVFDWDPDATYDLIGDTGAIAVRELFFPSPFFPLTLEGKTSARGEIVVESVSNADLTSVVPTAPAWIIAPRCQKLIKADGGPLGSSDPFFTITAPGNDAKLVYRSEVYTKNLNPTFKPFILNSADVGGPHGRFTVTCWDSDPDGANDVIGAFYTSLHELVAFGPFQYPLYTDKAASGFGNGKSGGAFCIDKMDPVDASQIPPPPMGFFITTEIKNLKRQDGPLSKADPWFAVMVPSKKVTATDSLADKLGYPDRETIYKSEVHKKTLTPKFNKFPLMLSQVNNSLDTPFWVVVFDYESDGDHQVVGTVQLTLRTLGLGPFHYPIIMEGQKTKSAGAFHVTGLIPITEPQGLENILNSGPVPPALRLKIRGEKFAKMDAGLSGGCDPFFKISDDMGRTVYRSAVCRKTLSPDWQEFDLLLSPTSWIKTVDDVITIAFFDWDVDGTHDQIGTLNFSLRDISFSWFEEAVRDNRGNAMGRVIFEFSRPIIDAIALPTIPTALRIATSAQKLKRMDGPLSKSDPFFVIRHQPPGLSYPITLYRSEVIKQNLAPTWRPFDLDVNMIGGIDVPFTITVHDWDGNGAHDEIGTVKTTIRDWSFGPYQQAIRNSSGDGCGAFSVDAVYHILGVPPLVLAPGYRLGVSAARLDKMDPGVTGSSDPFFEIRARPDGFTHDILLYRSEVIRKNLNPTWQPIVINSLLLGGFDKSFEIRVIDFDENGGHDEIGRTTTTIRELMFGSYQMGLKNPETRKDSGAFSVDWIQPLNQADDLPIAPLAMVLECSGVKLDKMDGGIGGKSDPFFEVYVRSDPSKPYNMYYRSEVHMKTLNPEWHPWLLNLKDCGGLDSAVRVKIYDFDADGAHDEIGVVEATPREWIFGSCTHAIINEEKQRSSSSYQTSGGFKIVSVTPSPVERPPLIIHEAYRIRLGGFKLARKDGPLSKSDPYFRLIAKPPGSKKRILLHRSEVVKQSLDCIWESFVLRTEDVRGLHTKFRVEVWDWDADGGHDLIGVAKIPLFQWMFGSYRVPLFKNLKGGGPSQGALSMEYMEPVEPTLLPIISPSYSITCSAAKVAKPGLIDKPDPFFEIRNADGHTLYRSEWVAKSSSPNWGEFRVDLLDLCKFDLDTKFEICCFDYSRSGEHTLLGSAKINFRELMFGPWQFALEHPQRSGSQGAFSVDGLVPVPPVLGEPPIPLAFTLQISGAKVKQRGVPAVCHPYFRVINSKGLTVYRSEVVAKNQDPDWKPFTICVRDMTPSGFYNPEEKFRIELVNFDVDTGIHESYGVINIPLRELTYKFYSGPVYSSGNSSNGSININQATPLLEAFMLPPDFPAYRIQAGATKLHKVDLIADPQTFFEVKAIIPDVARPVTLYRSQPTTEKTVNPVWPAFDLAMNMIGGMDAAIEISVFEFRKDGREFIGKASLTVRELTFGPYATALMRDGAPRGIFVVTDVKALTNADSIPPPAPAYRITASGNKLAKKDGTIIKTGSDPFLEIICKPPGAPRKVVYYRSEWIKQNTDPTWAPFILNTADVNGFDTLFEVRVWDYDPDAGHDFIGAAELTLREIALGPPFRMSLERKDKSDSQGAFNIDVVEPLPLTSIRSIAPAYEFTVSGTQLAAKDTFGKSDPFFVIRTTPPGFDHPITYYRSEHIAQTLDPCWKSFFLNVRDVGGLDNQFTIFCFDRDEDGQHDLIGSCTTTFRDWIMGKYSIPLRIHGETKSQGAFNIDVCTPLAEERNVVLQSSRNSSFMITCQGSKVVNQNGIIKTDASASDIFFELSSKVPDASDYVTIYRSERAPYGKGEPKFKPFPITLRDLRGLDSKFIVTLCQWQDSGDHILLGSFSTSFRDVCHVMTTGDSLLAACKPSEDEKSNGGFAFVDVRPIQPQEAAVFAPAYEFVLSGIKLEAMDRPKLGSITGSSDPFFVCRARPPGTSSTITIYRSEVISKNLNPAWKPFVLTLKQLKSIDTELEILVFDEDGDGDHGFIGRYVSTLRELILGPWRFPLSRSGKSLSGTLSLDSVRPIADLSSMPHIAPAYALQASGRKVISMDPGSKSDPFFIVFGKRQNSNEYKMLYRSEFIKDSDSPKWRPFQFNVADVGGLDTELRIETWDSDPDGVADFLGQFFVTLRDIMAGPFIYAMKPKGESSKSAGGFVIESCVPLPAAIQFPRPIPAVFRLQPKSFKLLKKSAKFALTPGAKCSAFFELFRDNLLIYRSEVKHDSSDPVWNTFALDLNADLGGSAEKPVAVRVWNWKENGVHQEIGTVDMKLTECGENDYVLALALNGDTGQGGISFSIVPDSHPIISTPAAPVVRSAPAFLVHASGRKIAKMDGSLLRKQDSDPFFRIIAPSGVCLYRSEWIMKTSNPDWKPFPISISDLVNKSIDDMITIEIFDYDADGGMDLCGRAQTSLRNLLHGLPYRVGLVQGDGKPGGAFEIARMEAIAQPLSNPLLNPPPGLELQVALRKMKRDKLRIGSPPDLFVTLSATPPGFNREIVLWRSEVVSQKMLDSDADSIDSTMRPFAVNVSDVRGVDSPFVMTVWEFSKGGDHTIVGTVKTTLREWFFGPYVHAIWHKHSSTVSRGAFCVDKVTPLQQMKYNITYAPAYKVQPSGFALQRMDGALRKSNAFFEIYIRLPGYDEETLYFRSNVIKESDEPQWQPFYLVAEDLGGFDNPFRIVLWDYHPNGLHLEIGTMYSTIRQMCISAPWRFAIENDSKRSIIAKYKSSGAFCIDALENLTDVNAAREAAFGAKRGAAQAKGWQFTAKGLDLDRKDGLPLTGKADPYFVVQRSVPGQHKHITVYRSEIIPQNLNPQWATFVVSNEMVGGVDAPFIIAVFDADEAGHDELIGSFTTSLRQLSFGEFTYALKNPKKIGRSDKTSAGGFDVSGCTPLDTVPAALPVAPAYTVTVGCKDLDRKSVLTECNTFFEVRSLDSARLIYRSEVHPSSASPTFKPFDLPASAVGGDIDAPFAVGVRYSDGEAVGAFITTIRDLSLTQPRYAIINPKKKLAIPSKSAGMFAVSKFTPNASYVAPPLSVNNAQAVKIKLSVQSLLDKAPKRFFTVESVDRTISVMGGVGDENDGVAPLVSKTQAFLLYRSEVLHNCLSPESDWPAFEIATSQVGSPDSILYFCVYSLDELNGQHELLGRCKTTLRDLSFTPFNIVLKHPKKKFPLPRVRGRLLVASAEMLPVSQVAVIPVGVDLRIELRSKSKLPEMMFEVWAHGTVPGRRLAYRSEARSNKSALLQWKEFPYWFFADPTASQAILEFAFYKFSDHKLKYVGHSIVSAAELFLSKSVIPLLAPDGLSVGGVEIAVIQKRDKPPQNFAATSYTVSGRVEGSENQLELYAYPCSFATIDGSPVLTWTSVGASQFHNAVWTLESVGGMDREFRFVVGKSFAKVTMRQLAQYGLPATFALGNCRVIIDHAQPTTGSIISYGLGFSAMDVDPTDGIGESSDPYLIIRRASDGVVVVQTEVVEQTLCPKWKPLQVDVASLGSLDADLIFEVWDYDAFSAHDFIGAATMSMRKMLLVGRASLINMNKKDVLSGYVNSGFLNLEVQSPNFVQQVLGAPFSIAENHLITM